MREFLDKIEEFISSREQLEQLLLTITLPLVLLILFYFFYITDALERYNSNEESIAKLSRQIRKADIKKFQQKITKEKHDILQLKTQNKLLEREIMMLQTEIDSNNFSFLTQAQIATYLETILKSSQRYGIDLESIVIEEKNIKKYGLLRNVKTIKVEADARFLKAVKFINSVELSTMILELNNLLIELNSTKPHITFDINLFKVIEDE